MPFTADTFQHLFDWEKDPQRQEKIVNARLEAEFDGVDTALSSLAAAHTTAESGAAYTLKGRNAGTTGAIADIDISAVTEKTTLVANDLLLLQDSAASNAFKRVKYSNINTNDTSEMTFYRSPGVALTGSVSNAAFGYPGTAATANTWQFYCSRIQRQINLAHWVIAWNPNTVGATESEVEIGYFPMAGGSDVQIARAHLTGSSPTSSGGAFITSELNTLITAGVDVNLYMKTKGDGTNSPLIYLSYIAVIWE
jgi:hypothetical protein